MPERHGWRRSSDELLVLEAMQRARFSIISIVRRHPIAGLIVKDLFRGVEVWLVDEGLESSLPDAAALATRLFTPEGFAMTAGVLVPLDSELIENAVANTPQLLHKRPDEVIDDRRFAEAIYRAALARGIMQQVAYQDGIAPCADQHRSPRAPGRCSDHRARLRSLGPDGA